MIDPGLQSDPVVRNPVDRFVAAFNANKGKPPFSTYEDINAFCLDLHDFIDATPFIPQHFLVNNGQEQAGGKPADSNDRAVLSEQSLKILSEIYYRDFQVFGYPLPTTTAMTDILEKCMSGMVSLCFLDANYISVFDLFWRHYQKHIPLPLVPIFMRVKSDPPDTVRPGWAHLEWDGTLAHLWRLRTELYFLLIANGLPFTHFDVDAIPLKDCAALFPASDAAFTFSQGTIWPPQALKAFHSVFCCGFFSCRSDLLCLKIIRKMRDFADRNITDAVCDQYSFNTVFAEMDLRPLGQPVPTDTGEVDHQEFAIYDETVEFISPQGDKIVALLPMRQVTRISKWYGPATCIYHPLSPKDAGEKLSYFSGQGID